MTTAVFLALAAAMLYGASDFIGGVLSRRIHYLRVGLVGQLAAATGGLAAALLVGGRPGSSAILWGTAAGVGGAVGTLALYRGLSRGRMSVAGPLSAVGAAGLPIPVDLLSGHDLTAVWLVGIGLAIPGIWLVSSQSGKRGREGVAEGLIAGLGFATLFVCLDRAGESAGLWPVAAGQLTGVVVLSLGILISRERAAHNSERAAQANPLRPTLAAIWPGVMGVGATLLYALSTQVGTLTIAAVITSLYPAFTIVLAALLLQERIGRAHGAGLVLCASAVGAFVAG